MPVKQNPAELPLAEEVAVFMAKPRPPRCDEAQSPLIQAQRQAWRRERFELARRLYATGRWRASTISEAFGQNECWWNHRMREHGIPRVEVTVPREVPRRSIDAILAYVADRPQGVTRSELADHLKVTRQRVHQLVKMMAAMGRLRVMPTARWPHTHLVFLPEAS